MLSPIVVMAQQVLLASHKVEPSTERNPRRRGPDGVFVQSGGRHHSLPATCLKPLGNNKFLLVQERCLVEPADLVERGSAKHHTSAEYGVNASAVEQKGTVDKMILASIPKVGNSLQRAVQNYFLHGRRSGSGGRAELAG